jgi:hypothetical protein
MFNFFVKVPSQKAGYHFIKKKKKEKERQRAIHTYLQRGSLGLGAVQIFGKFYTCSQTWSKPNS